MSLKNKNIVITTGGTGGHIYPAIVLADLLKQNNANIIWISSTSSTESMESRIIPKYFNIKYIKSSGIRGKNIFRKIFYLFQIFLNIIKSRNILKKVKADLVIGFGSYVSAPICLAAAQKNIPIIIHEQNTIIGLTNRILARFAKIIYLAFDITNIKNQLSIKQLKKIKVVGNPIRKNIISLNNKVKKYDESSRLKILVLGGSQGAQTINRIIPKLIKKAIDNEMNIKVWHQTGKFSFESTKNDYKNIPKKYIRNITDFIDNISEVYNWADLVICRAGALTISECMIAGLPAIFLPLQSAVDDHQFFNAQYIVNKKAGFCIRDKITLESLFNIVSSLYQNKSKLKKMSQIAKKILIKNSSELILNDIKKMLNKNK